MRESEVLKRVRLKLQALAVTLFRNNVGVYQTEEGHWIRYGLCNGSADLIGWTEHTIRPNDVGKKAAIFTAIETKRSRGGRQAESQKLFLSAVARAGGIAGFAANENEAVEHVKQWTEVKHD